MLEWAEPAATVVAAIVAIIAVFATWLARRDSKRSAVAAERSAASSEDSANSSANSAAVAQREEARRIERTDVEWQRVVERPERGGHLEFRNIGSTTAYVVTAVLTINGERVHLQQDEVRAAESITYDASKLGKQVVTAAFLGGPGGSQYAYGTRFNVNARVTWQSELGTPGVWASDSSRAKVARTSRPSGEG